MKTIKTIVYTAFLSLLMVSCDSDFLNTIPKDRLASDIFWQTEEDAIYASTGMYSRLEDQWRYTSMDAYSDSALHCKIKWAMSE